MKPFRLAPVLRIRQMQERIAAAESALAANAVREAEAQAADLGAQVLAIATPETATGAEFLYAVSHGHRLADDAACARDVVVERVAQAHVAQGAWTRAAQSTKALEKMEERHRQEVNSALEHAEVKAIDDLVTRVYAVRSQSEERQ